MCVIIYNNIYCSPTGIGTAHMVKSAGIPWPWVYQLDRMKPTNEKWRYFQRPEFWREFFFFKLRNRTCCSNKIRLVYDDKLYDTIPIDKREKKRFGNFRPTSTSDRLLLFTHPKYNIINYERYVTGIEFKELSSRCVCCG